MKNDNQNNILLDLIFHHILDSEPYFSVLNLEISKHAILIFIAGLIGFFFIYYISINIHKQNRISTFFEILFEFISKNILAPNFEKKDINLLLPFFFTLFLFILISNLLGLIPYSSTITGNLSINIVLSFFILVLTPFYGMKKQGYINYWIGLIPKNINPIIAAFLFFIEILGLFIKPIALSIRLFANMISGHIMIIIFLYLAVKVVFLWVQAFITPIFILLALLISVFEIFISILQAYIFTFLSAIFVSLAGKKH